MRIVLAVGAGIAAGYVIRGKLDQALLGGKEQMREAMVDGMSNRISDFMDNRQRQRRANNVSYAEKARRNMSYNATN